jgi:hypothetical protein
MNTILLEHIHEIHTTQMGIERIRKNLSLDCEDVVFWCKNAIQNPSTKIERRGKNYYAQYLDNVITVNAYSYTIITAHKTKDF